MEAWLRHYDDDKEVFLKELKEFPSSIEDNHRFEELVDLPVDPENAITFGITGSNQRFSETRPDETESLILRALAGIRYTVKNTRWNQAKERNSAERLGGYP